MTYRNLNKNETIEITTEFIRLDSALKLAGAVDTGGQAKFVIQEGYVKVNDEVCTMRGKKIRPGDVIVFDRMTVFVKESSGNDDDSDFDE